MDLSKSIQEVKEAVNDAQKYKTIQFIMWLSRKGILVTEDLPLSIYYDQFNIEYEAEQNRLADEERLNRRF